MRRVGNIVDMRMLFALGVLIVACGTSSSAWCGNKDLWEAYDSGGGVVSYKPSQLKKTGTPKPTALSTFIDASGLAFDKSNNLWVVEDGKTVAEFSAAQLKSLKKNSDPTPIVTITSAATFGFLFGCNFDPQGNLWLADYTHDSIYELSAAQLRGGSGDVTPAIVISSGSLDGPNFVTFDSSGNAWVDDENHGGKLLEFTSNQLTSGGAKTPQVVISDDGSGTSLFAPGEIAFDKSGNLWVPNYDADTVVEYAKSQLSNSGNPAPIVKLTSAAFDGPFGAVLDSKGNLWVANYNDQQIDKFAASQLGSSGSPTPAVTLTGPATQNYQIIFGPAS